MRTLLLTAITFGVAAAVSASSSFVLFAGPAGTGALLVRSLLLSFSVGALSGAALTRIFRKTSQGCLGALYAALLGFIVNGFASSFSSVGGLPFNPAQIVFALMNHISLGALVGLVAWALPRLGRTSASPPPDTKTRLLIAALFASTTAIICLAFVLPWEESGDFIPTWRTPATAVAITVLPAASLAAALSAALAGYSRRAISMRFGFLYVLLLGFYALQAAQTLGGALLSVYINQRTTDLILSPNTPPLAPGRASASFYVIAMGGDEAWRMWVFPTLSVLACAVTWFYLRRRERTQRPNS